MSWILSLDNRAVLEQFAWSNTLVGFDYDGTLVPIVADPALAAMRTSTRRLVRELTLLYPCVVISGRARADVRRRVANLGVRQVIGNHGLEPWRTSRQPVDEVRIWAAALERDLAGHAGVWIEDKGYSIAVHYRRSREKRRARAAIFAAAEKLANTRLIDGKLVVNVLPRNAPHKGDALQRERARQGCDTAIYVGDDETDEDVFALDQPGRLLTIRVGVKRASLAAYWLRDQPEVDDLIRALVQMRRGQASLRRASA